MNYHHAFHAGNFADCVKHAALVGLLRALARKPAPLFVLDTHAGAGHYDLTHGPAERSGEWRSGIGRLLDDTPAALAEYVGLVRELGLYPGSPALIRGLLRPGDCMACCELNSEEATALRRRFARDRQVAVHHRDGWEALGALLPPPQKRGLILIDPPYEARDEFAHLLAGLSLGDARFRPGHFVAWYPIKHRAPVRAFHHAVAASRIRDVIAAEFLLREPTDPGRLNGCGLLIVNPPHRFEETARPMLGALLGRLGDREAGEGVGFVRLVDE
jgi:23S rRNA (adenine2030-N6)-methyltransferase